MDPPVTDRRIRTEAIGSRYIIVLLVLSFLCFLSYTSLIDDQLTSYITVAESLGTDVTNYSSRRVDVTIQNAVIVESSNVKMNATGFGRGQFCSFCPCMGPLAEDLMCARRLQHHIEETEEKESVIKRLTSIDDEPSIILHVGPHKTGTTALQSFIYDLVKANSGIFLEDNLRIPLNDELPGYFQNAGVGLNLPHCSLNRFVLDNSQMSERMCGFMRRAFPKFVADAYNKSQNILLVAEDFDRSLINFDRLHFFLRPYKKIKVISTYRRLHDWLPSWYNQIVDHYNVKYSSGKEKFPTFLQWLEEQYGHFIKAHGVVVAERFKSYEFIESVHLINMHDMTPDLVGTFFCNILQTKAICKAIKDGATASNANIGFDHEYQRLAIEAKLGRKLPSSSLQRKVQINRVSTFLKTKVEMTNTTLPRLCASNETLEKILTQELEHERKYFLRWFESQGGEEALRQSFKKAVKKNFCVLDVMKIFDTGIMDDIFKEVTRLIIRGLI